MHAPGIATELQALKPCEDAYLDEVDRVGVGGAQAASAASGSA